MPQYITVGRDTFEVVQEYPLGHQIWNIGKHMADGYLPFCRVIPGTYRIEPDTLKAIPLEGAQTILAAIGGGENTIAKMERYLSRHTDPAPGSYAERQVQRIKAALPWMRQIPGMK